MASYCLVKIQSRVEGHHVYNYTFKVVKTLNCSIENDNEYQEKAIAVFPRSKNMAGHIPELLAKIFSLLFCT